MESAASYCEDNMSVYCRFILTPIRHLGPKQASIIAGIAQESIGGRLTGFGMGGDEQFGRPKDFLHAFDMAREAGYQLTSHAGELVGPHSVFDSLEYLKVERIGHGVRAIEDTLVVQRLIDENITLEVNPGSNIFLGIYDSLNLHPIQRLREMGVQVTVSTDDPPFFKTDMTKEYTNLAKAGGTKTPLFADDEAALLQNETALGYRFKLADIPAFNGKEHYDIILNPTKTDLVNFNPDDKIIVLADDDERSK